MRDCHEMGACYLHCIKHTAEGKEISVEVLELEESSQNLIKYTVTMWSIIGYRILDVPDLLLTQFYSTSLA